MKMRKRIAALIAAAMIASLMPMTAFAASDNRLNKTINIKKDTDLTSEHAVELVITMKKGDDLNAGDEFYLELTDGEWAAQVDFDALMGSAAYTVENALYKITRDSKKELAITIKTGQTVTNNEIIKIPMLAAITGDDPTVEINPQDSAVSAGKFAIAISSKGKAIVTVGSVPTIAGKDKMATITFDEPFIRSFNSNDVVTVELRDSDFSFAEKGVLKGTKAYRTFGSASDVRIVDDQTLEIKLPALTATQRGGFELKDVEIRADRNAREGDVKATISGDFVDKQVVTVAKYGDYATKLTVAKDDYEVVAGKDIDVEFKLSEEMPDALRAGRPVTFEFSKDIIIEKITLLDADKDNNSEDTIMGGADHNVTINKIKNDDGDLHTNEFVVDNFDPDPREKSSYKFEATLLVPAGYEGDIVLTAEGRGLEEKKEIVVAKTEAPVTVEATTTTVKVGLQKQETNAKIVIKETKEDRITKGGNIRVELGTSNDGIEFDSVSVKVTDGDLEIADKDDIDVKDGVIIIPVKRHSTEASTIEITDIVIKTDRTVPQGSYDVKVGGSAISDFTEKIHFGDKKSRHDGTKLNTPVLDEVAKVKDFIIVGTPNTEDINKGKKAVVNFVIGNNKFLVDGVEMEMDAAPYIKDGRTMVPLRYLSAALGVDTESIKFNSGVVTIFAEAGKVIQVSVGSKNLVVNGMTIPMVAAAEIIDGRTYVPVTEIGGVFGVSGSWDAATQTATFK